MKNCELRIRLFYYLLFAMMLALSLISGKPKEMIDHHGERIDADNSMSCISCHDGTIGMNVRYCTVKCDISKGHVVFQEYPPFGKEREFVPRTVAESNGIVFENGQVTCISCHDIRNGGPNHLIAVRRNEGLCLSCHIR